MGKVNVLNCADRMMDYVSDDVDAIIEEACDSCDSGAK